MEVDPLIPDNVPITQLPSTPPPLQSIVSPSPMAEEFVKAEPLSSIEDIKITNNTDTSETCQPANFPDKNILSAILHICRNYNLKKTEEAFKSEVHITSDMVTVGSETDVNKVLSAYKSEGDPDVYKEAYSDLMKFVENSLDIYKHELGTILYPMFVHMYLELVYNGYKEQAIDFMQTYGPKQEDYYQDDIRRFSTITVRDQMKGNEIAETFNVETKRIGLWTEESLSGAIAAISQGMSVRKASIEFRIPRSTLRNHIKNGSNIKKFGRKTILNSDEENELCRRILHLSDVGIPLTGKLLRKTVFTYAKENGLENCFNTEKGLAGRKWLQLFLKRHPEIVVIRK